MEKQGRVSGGMLPVKPAHDIAGVTRLKGKIFYVKIRKSIFSMAVSEKQSHFNHLKSFLISALCRLSENPCFEITNIQSGSSESSCNIQEEKLWGRVDIIHHMMMCSGRFQ